MKRISALAISTLLALSIPTAYADECDIPDVYGYDYNYIDCLSEGIAWVRKDGKYGFVDKTGKVVIPLIYDYAGSFSESLA
ncbi:WG repeat-containing protein, partial [Moraxella sp.]|uniref:WG repeat-containing protein n=1 Tax=Moraxella sp. TaxID=479 RepID=UPI0026282D7F